MEMSLEMVDSPAANAAMMAIDTYLTSYVVKWTTDSGGCHDQRRVTSTNKSTERWRRCGNLAYKMPSLTVTVVGLVLEMSLGQ